MVCQLSSHHISGELLPKPMQPDSNFCTWMLYSCCFGRHLVSFGDCFLQTVPHLQALTFLISLCRPCSSCFRWQVVTTIWHCGCTPCANFWGSHRSCHWFVLQWRWQVATVSSYGCHCACVGCCCRQADRCHACGHSCDSSLTFTRHGHAGHLTCELQWHLYMVSNFLEQLPWHCWDSPVLRPYSDIPH